MIDFETVKEIKKLSEKGISVSRISRELNISRPTVLKCLREDDGSQSHHEGQYPFIPKKNVIPVIVEHPSPELKKERESTESRGQEVLQAKSTIELMLAEREIKKLSKEDERIEEIGRHNEWIQKWQDWALNSIVSYRDLPITIRFSVKDKVREVLQHREESDGSSVIRELVEETIANILLPYFNSVKESQKKKSLDSVSQMVERALYSYLPPPWGSSSDPVPDEENKMRAKRFVLNYFERTLSSNGFETISSFDSIWLCLYNFFHGIRI